jgi:hypothetical protein
MIVTFGFLIVNKTVQAQELFYEPFSEAEKAISAKENAPIILDSLKRVYKDRWTVGLTYGQRFISRNNRSTVPDTLTFADFTTKRSFFGLQSTYFISNRTQLTLSAELMLLPREQEITTIQINSNGIDVEGQGNGGALLTIGVGARYYILDKSKTRPYAGIQVGTISARAKGGTGGFGTFRGGFEEIVERNQTFPYASIMGGVALRITPGLMFDFNIGYTGSRNSDNIGGITSPGGITSSLTMQFVIGARKNR